MYFFPAAWQDGAHQSTGPDRRHALPEFFLHPLNESVQHRGIRINDTGSHAVHGVPADQARRHC